ncbi:hypothetical protein GCM10010965_25540 [Caldalkalibacillus thermarum]|uniref:hypothetical protein n=1 Tax=Caldalkalibacillus thermarum TaxID=296745 RepID=UPI00166A2108|nr:hypothetical protein GCM10010965_25540 [Caldalkalibacillus thermarum]
MLIKELKARESVKRILILVPPLVLKQWQMELEEKFGDLVITDGTGRELTAELLYLAKRENGTIISLDSYWLFQSQFEGEHISLNESHDPELHSAAVKAPPDQLLRASIGLGFKRARLKNVYSILRGKDLQTGEFPMSGGKNSLRF